MSIVDQVIAAVTPPESDEERFEARARARSVATPGDWLSLVLDQHEQLQAAFDAVEHASTEQTQRAAQKELGTLLTGHANAEETALYPALAQDGQKGHATMGYTEQAAVKMQMAELERLQPLTKEYSDKLGHIRGAVEHHMYQEESSWFLDMKQHAPAEEQAMATQRFQEEYDRYIGEGGNFESTLIR